MTDASDRAYAVDRDFGSLPFAPLFRTGTEAAAELSNQTVHGVVHLAWADQGQGRYQGQLASYVKPRGRLGKAYVALVKPFRYAVAYPALMRQIERARNARAPRAAVPTSLPSQTHPGGAGYPVQPGALLITASCRGPDGRVRRPGRRAAPG